MDEYMSSGQIWIILKRNDPWLKPRNQTTAGFLDLQKDEWRSARLFKVSNC